MEGGTSSSTASKAPTSPLNTRYEAEAEYTLKVQSTVEFNHTAPQDSYTFNPYPRFLLFLQAAWLYMFSRSSGRGGICGEFPSPAQPSEPQFATLDRGMRDRQRRCKYTLPARSGSGGAEIWNLGYSRRKIAA